jgi:hypothetical protein
MIPLSPTLIGAAAAGVAILVLVGAVKVQTSRLESCKQEFEAFQTKVRTLGELQEAETKRKDAANAAAKEKADDQAKRRRAADAAIIRSLRESRPGSSVVPAAPATSSRPDLACFERFDYQRTTGEFIEAVRGLADEGSAATLSLDVAKEWAQQLK